MVSGFDKALNECLAKARRTQISGAGFPRGSGITKEIEQRPKTDSADAFDEVDPDPVAFHTWG